jgi:hypothetical protein
MTPADIAPILAENGLVRQAFGAALLSLEGMTRAQFEAQYPDVDIAALTADPDFMRWMETFAGMPTVQDRALDAQLRRGLAESVTGLVNRIQAPDISGAALGAASDALTKITNLWDRRDATKRDGGEQGLIRHLSRFGPSVSIKTVEGVTEFDLIEYRTFEQNLEAVRAMRCTTEAEARVVLTALRSNRPAEVLNLRGF